MSTINSKKIIDELIANNGYYEDDPRVHKIVEYTNAWGKQTWGVVWENESMLMKLRYEIETEYVRNPRVIWRAT